MEWPWSVAYGGSPLQAMPYGLIFRPCRTDLRATGTELSLMSDEQTINVRLNGKDRQIRPGLSVQALVESLDLNPQLIVVELNREILCRDCFGETLVSEGDQVELVHFVGGG